MSLKNTIQYALTKVKYMFSEARIIPDAGLIIAGLILRSFGFDKKVDKFTPPQKEYKNSDILKAMLIGILNGDPDFEAIHATDDDPEYYCNAMFMRRMPSEATMRQRMDEIGDSLQNVMREANVDFLTHYGIQPSALENGYVPIDIDVSPFINEKCEKEGISKTYKLKDGYAPIFAYIGAEGYLLACELREGKQHCQKDTLPFLEDVLRLARKVTDKPLLVRLDSGNDAAENINSMMERCLNGDHVHFIIKRNLRKESPKEWLDTFRDVCTNIKEPREGKKEYVGQTFRNYTVTMPDPESGKPCPRTVGIRTIYDITERTCDHDGQMYLEPKVECDMYSTNVDFPDEDIIGLYHQHGEMEQYHSEIKTDMGAEILPSGKFKTNELVLELIQLAYNILRAIGQESLKYEDIKLKRPVKRRRLRTVIENVIMAPGVMTRHARQARMDLGASNPWRHAIAGIWERFAVK